MKNSHPLASTAAAVAVVAVVTFGLHYGLFVAAAADAYGYVSQADLWASGAIVRQPFAEAMTWRNADVTLAPSIAVRTGRLRTGQTSFPSIHPACRW
jgi:hypothetical protein